MIFLRTLALNLGEEVLEPHWYLCLLMLSPRVGCERQRALVQILLHCMDNIIAVSLLSLHHLVAGLVLQIEELFVADKGSLVQDDELGLVEILF
jgi:hypothetical protein